MRHFFDFHPRPHWMNKSDVPPFACTNRTHECNLPTFSKSKPQPQSISEQCGGSSTHTQKNSFPKVALRHLQNKQLQPLYATPSLCEDGSAPSALAPAYPSPMGAADFTAGCFKSILALTALFLTNSAALVLMTSMWSLFFC